MKLSTLLYRTLWIYGIDAAIKMLADAGFDALDYSLTCRAIPWEETLFTDVFSAEFAEYFRHSAKVAADCGIEILQTHAPYCPTNLVDSNAYALTAQQTIRAIYATGYMHCPYIVAHPVVHPDFHRGQNRDRAVQTNVDYFSAFVPALKETGVIMCIENLHWADKGYNVIPNACSDPEQLITLVDTLNEMYGPHFAICLDTGHAMLVGNNPSHMLREFGDRVKTLHVHDTDGAVDYHWIPGRGAVNWQEFSLTLKEVGYTGTFNFEADGYFEDFENEIYDKTVHEKAAEVLCAVGRSLIQ